MIKFYVSCRPVLRSGAWDTPKHLLSHSFAGMNLLYRLVAWSPDTDGRMLYEITVSDHDHMDVIIEALASYSGHRKTIGSARALAETITGGAWSVAGDGTADWCDPASGIFPAG